MGKKLIIAIGAGVAAAILFIVPVKGTMAAMLLAIFTPLPIMIAGLAFSPTVAAMAAIAGIAATALILHPLPALVFGIWAAIPAWWLTRLAWLARPPETGETAGPDGLVWFPPGRLLLWAAGFGATATLVIIFAGIMRFGSYADFIANTAKVLTGMFENILKNANAPQSTRAMSPADLANFFIRTVLPQLAAWGCLTLSINLWIAGRIARSSQQLTRTWPDIAAELRLPQILTVVVAAALAVSFIEGLPRMIAAIIAAACGMALALQGFAVLHAITRGTRNRNMNLALIYILNIVLMPGPLFVAVIAGAADTFLDFRTRIANRRGGPPSNSGGWPPPPANTNGQP